VLASVAGVSTAHGRDELKRGHSKPSATARGGGEVFSDGVNELNDLGSTTMSLDPCFVFIAASPAKAGLRHGADVGTVDGKASHAAG
jgi:hypothetical protein